MPPRSYDIGLPVQGADSAEDAKPDLVELDRRVSEAFASKLAGGSPGDPWLEMDVWEKWLWGTDPHEATHPDVMMNENHLYGLFLARYMATYHGGATDELLSGLLPQPLCLFAERARDLTLRQLRDTVQNLQCCWIKGRAGSLAGCMGFLDACFCRLGELALTGGDQSIMNDQGAVEDDPSGCLKLTATSIRRFATVFHILYRHLFITQNCIPLDDGLCGDLDCGILLHHMRSACDEYYDLSLHWALLPGHKLLYVHDFPSMFHSISQVVYFHNADHVLVPHDLRPELANKGELEAVHILPVLKHLYPDIEILYECADIEEFAAKGRYAFFLIAHEVYLLTPELEFFSHPNIVVLLKKYLDDTGVGGQGGPPCSPDAP